MFDFMVTADGGLTSVFSGHLSGRQKFRQEKAYCKTAGILCGGYCISFCYFLSENLQTAVGRQCYTLQYAFYCTDRKLVWCGNWNYGRACLRNPAVYSGTLCTFFFPGML